MASKQLGRYGKSIKGFANFKTKFPGCVLTNEYGAFDGFSSSLRAPTRSSRV